MTSLWSQLRACSTAPLPTRFPTDTVVLFAPRDNAPLALQTLIAAAKTSVKVEMFTYTDKALDALLHQKAATAGISFQMTFDASQSVQEPAMARLVAGWQADLGARVVTGHSEHNEIIHRKVVVIDHLYVAGGSTNWTVSGERFEDNELVIRRSAPLAAWYEQILDANFARVRAAMPPTAAAA